MKYIVMECCKGYAVLMDEDGRYVFAANLNYEVGQTVTNPVIMSQQHKNRSTFIKMTRTAIAAAACIAVIALPCYGYYAKNFKTCSTVTLASDTSISMNLNSSGKVISLESDTEYGEKIIEKVDIKGKDKVEAANEIVQAEISEGYISAGDTVDVYIDGSNSKDYENIKSKLEEELPKHHIKVNIHDKKHPAVKDDKVKNEDKLPHEKTETPAPPHPDTEAAIKPAATKPVEAPKPPVKDNKPIHVVPSEPAEIPVPPAEGDLPPVHEKPIKPEHQPPSDNIGDKDNKQDDKPAPPVKENVDIPHHEKAHQQKNTIIEPDIVVPLAEHPDTNIF